jgi:hypothetical protein
MITTGRQATACVALAIEIIAWRCGMGVALIRFQDDNA